MGQGSRTGVPPGRGRRAGKTCLGAVVLVLVAGLLATALSQCPLHRALPTVPPLPPAPEGIAKPATVRVLVAHLKGEYALACEGGGAWYGIGDSGERPIAEGDGPWVVTANEGRLVLDGVEQPEPRLELRPNGAQCSVDDRAYRGGLSVKAGSEGRLTVYNLIEPEDYLRSVVGSEMYSDWPLETLMAQAVAARSFMFYTLAAKGYLSRADMSYKGIAAESREADLATELTRGIVLTYRSKVLPAYFTNTCGGRTIRVEKVFALEPMEPLAGVRCDWCRESPSYEWAADLAPERIAEALKNDRISMVSSIEPEGAGADGYARYVLINGEVRLGAQAFGLAMGPGVIRSPCFTVAAQDGRFVFQGRGSGHGVGLCQWGARGLAEAGKGWMDVLLYYYPGAELHKAY